MYLSTKNLVMPKGHASKLVPKFIGPYKVLQAMPETSNYELESSAELTHQCIRNWFHRSLLRPHCPNDDILFPNRCYPDPYDFGAPEDTKWFIKEIMAHRWKGCGIKFEVRWSLGHTTWEPLSSCNELAALDAYLMLLGSEDWTELPRHTGRPAHQEI
jgi:hypothetical protein